MRQWCLVSLIVAVSVLSYAGVPASNHVYIVLEENHSYESVVGNMPYLNGLAAQYSLLTNSYASSHYSIPNYMWLAAGASVTMNDNTTAKFTVDNITQHLAAAGKTWKEYAEALPFAGYTGYNTPAGCSPSTCVYVERHDPFPYFNNVAGTGEKMNIVPFTQLATDIQHGTLPNYAFITPDLQHDAHNGTLATADSWLKTNIAPLLATPAFQAGGDGILIVTFDESYDSDCRPLASCPSLPENGGGGRIYTVVIGPRVKRGYKSNVFAQHPAVLRTIMEALGLASTGFPGAAATAGDLSDVFASGSDPLSITPSSANLNEGQTLQFTANQSVTWSASGGSITSTGVYTAPKMLGSFAVTAKDSSGSQALATVTINSSTSPVVTISAPASGATVASTFTVKATFTNGGTAQYMKLWVDGIATYAVNNATTLSKTLSLGAGTHRLTVQAYNGTLYHNTEYVTVQ
jgi:acid phosphatase